MSDQTSNASTTLPGPASHSLSRSHWPWIGISSLLLLVYLTFFHLCLNANYGMCIAIGFGSWVVWCLICVVARRIFLSRFEYWIHQLVGIDILLEGFNPLHEGYGFYYCATSFWIVFLIYRFIVAVKLEHGLAEPADVETASGLAAGG